jgi:hypothetical protein
MTDAAQYEKQLQTMLRNGRKWLALHPKADIKIQWNFPRNVALICSISDAINHHHVSANDDGLALMKALWDWDAITEPTVLMTRVAIENMFPLTRMPHR